MHIMDWWEGKEIRVTVPALPSDTAHGAAGGAGGGGDEGGNQKGRREGDREEECTLTARITCTPAQHFTGRGLLDRFKTLWASWAVEEVLSPSLNNGPHPAAVAESSEAPRDAVKVYFAGDTGYRAWRDGEEESELPVCPAFAEIGRRFGGFEFAMVPIGAYDPRVLWSPVHCAPVDSVQLFKDIRAKRALGMHWGYVFLCGYEDYPGVAKLITLMNRAWMLTGEDFLEPPGKLREECEKAGVGEDEFGVCGIGETRVY